MNRRPVRIIWSKRLLISYILSSVLIVDLELFVVDYGLWLMVYCKLIVLFGTCEECNRSLLVLVEDCGCERL